MREESDFVGSDSVSTTPSFGEDYRPPDRFRERARYATFDELRRHLPPGWEKILGGVASLALFAFAAFILARTFSQIHFADVRAAITATTGSQVLEALGLTALSYLALTGYDELALRQLKMRIRYPVVALASFASYAFSFNLGFPVVTGAAVRYWVYLRERTTALQVANITIISGATFWLGMTVVFGASLMARAEQISLIDAAPSFVNFLFGALTLAGVVYYCAWVSLDTRRMRIRGHVFELPGFWPTLGQTVLGVVDLCCAAAALFMLLPDGHGLDLTTFLAIYVFACILGVVSHAPGGIGVFEATMLHAIPSHSQESLLASLMLFRLIYYFIPFILALALLGADEVGRRWDGLRDAISKIVENRD